MLNKKNTFILLILFAFLASCGPIHRFTRIKKTPRRYTFNYCGEPIKAPKSEFNKEPWVVFSDRDNNDTYQNPGGKVKMKKADFMDAFFVIKVKGEYLRLIKYDPEIVENGNLKDRKKAQYYGWMHKSRLVLTKQSITDIASSFKNKQLSIITDTVSLVEPELFFDTDSIRVFRDLNLVVNNGKIPFYEIVYTLKTTDDGKKTLLSRKSIISPDDVYTDVLGWVNSSLVKNVGQRLHVDMKSLPEDTLLFKDMTLSDTLPVSKWAFDEMNNFMKRHSAMKFNPVISYCNTDSGISFKTGVPSPIVDMRDNYVFNVNGNKITYGKFKELEKDLRKLNVMFVFEGKEQVIENYPALVNVVQNLQPLFETEDDVFEYKFGAVLAFQGQTEASYPHIESKGLSDSYSDILEFLITKVDSTDQFSPLPTQYTWSGIRKAVNMIQPYKDETNIFVVIGETGYSEWADSVLVKRMAESNCRVLGFQLHGGESNSFNNFVLQIENMIEHCAARESVAKREKIVYVDQLRPRNQYRESSKNVYALDFPSRSMTQGWILFPEKSQTLPLDILTNCIDTIVNEVKWDNDNIINSLYQAFNLVGNHRYQYDSLLVQYNHLDSTQVLNRQLPTKFTNELPAWYLPANKVSVADSVDEKLRYHLLLSKDELEELTKFINNLSANEVDYKYKGKKSKVKKRCNCPDDDEIEVLEIQTDSLGQPKYMSTGKIRKKLQKVYYDELKTCKACKIKTRQMKCFTLAQAQQRITGCPSYSPILERYVVNDIKRKKCMPDPELDALIEYFKKKKEAWEKYLNNPVEFESNGQTYYWVDQRILP